MLSILIPVFNFDITFLVAELHRQTVLEKIPFEIICFDDHSSRSFRTINKKITELPYVLYEELPENMGRSKIRNRLASKAQYKYLLFMDCDSGVVSTSYISNYIRILHENKVIFGGRSYEDKPSNPNVYLRWLYGIKRESKRAEERKKTPYLSFMTNNFIIPKAVFEYVRFNEILKGYGHEDTLFAQELKKNYITIEHIDNPLCHLGLEESEEFLNKTRQGVKNLAFLINQHLLNEDVKLYYYYLLLNKIGVSTIVYHFLKKMDTMLIKNLTSLHPSLRLFDLYKMKCLISEMKK